MKFLLGDLPDRTPTTAQLASPVAELDLQYQKTMISSPDPSSTPAAR